MFYIRIPFPVGCIDAITGEPATISDADGVIKKMPPVEFGTFAIGFWLADTRMGTDPVSLARVAKLVDAFRAAKPGAVLALEDQDHEKIKVIVQAPNRSYLTTIAMQLLPFMRAILDASPTNPAEVVAPSAEAVS